MMLIARVTLLLMVGLCAWLLARHRSASLWMRIAPRVTPYSLPVTVARAEFPTSQRALVKAVRVKPVMESVNRPPIFAIWLTIAVLLLARRARSAMAAELLRRRVGNGD